MSSSRWKSIPYTSGFLTWTIIVNSIKLVLATNTHLGPTSSFLQCQIMQYKTRHLYFRHVGRVIVTSRLFVIIAKDNQTITAEIFKDKAQIEKLKIAVKAQIRWNAILLNACKFTFFTIYFVSWICYLFDFFLFIRSLLEKPI